MDIPLEPDPVAPTASLRPKPVSQGRRITGLVIRLALLAGLVWLTYANATDSRVLREAAEAEARGDFPGALKAATEHLDRRPWSLEASRISARCLSRLDYAELAEPYYRKGGGLSVADLRFRAYGLTRSNLRERAVAAFDEVLAQEPDDLASLRLKAGLLISMTRWDGVLEIGQRLLKWRTKSAEVEAPTALGGHWTFKPMELASVPTVGATLEAIALHNQEEPEAAIRAFERVLELDPALQAMPLDRRLFWSQFGEDLLATGRATDLIRLATAEDPGRAEPGLVALKARAYAQLGSSEEAENSWRRVVELAPTHPSAWLNLGRIESGKGNAEEAARLLARAAELAPESVDAAYNLGLTFRRLGRADEARKWEQEAARLRLRLDAKSRPNAASIPPTTPAS